VSESINQQQIIMTVDDKLDQFELQLFRYFAGYLVGKLFLYGTVMLFIYSTLIQLELSVLGFNLTWLEAALEIFANHWIRNSILIVMVCIGYWMGMKIGRDIWQCQRKYILLSGLIFISLFLMFAPFILMGDNKLVYLLQLGFPFIVFMLMPICIKFLFIPKVKRDLIRAENKITGTN
tara:strand:+ start:458 stop:991 length:534 start_codon:yes stop_codon:yes gene_type:complete